MLLASILATLIRAFYHASYARTSSEQLASARRTLVAALADPQNPQLKTFYELRFRVRVRALVELARGVTGAQLRQARDIALQAGVVQAAEGMTHSRHWWKRLYGARILTLLGPDSGHIGPLLYDPHPLVRAQAAEWATTRPDEQRIEALVIMVFDDVAFCRFSATDALLRIGTPAVPALVRRLDQTSGLIVIPLLDIAAGIGSPAFLGNALRLSSAYESEVRVRAAQVLGAIGGEKSIAKLLELLEDPESTVVAAAANALGGLEHWKAAPRLAGLLEREQPAVRAAAAQALRAVGAPGELLLRKAARASSVRGAAAAREALDSPYLGGVV